MAYKTVRDFVVAVGQDALQGRVNVGARMMRHVMAKDKMPPGWYAESVDLADEQGLKEPPRELFDFITSDKS